MENHNIKLFDQISSQWRKNIPKKNYIIAKEIIESLHITKDHPFWMLDAVQVFYIL